MKSGIATLAAAAALAFAVGPAFAARTAPMEAFVPVPRSVIDAGPVIPADSPETLSNAEVDYMHTVCPTVLHSPSQYRANLVEFCKEYRAG